MVGLRVVWAVCSALNSERLCLSLSCLERAEAEAAAVPCCRTLVAEML